MLRVSSFWASYIHWEKVHNFAITCISPLIHSGYTTFVKAIIYMPMFFITSDFFTSTITLGEAVWVFISFVDVQNWNGPNFQKFHINAVRAWKVGDTDSLLHLWASLSPFLSPDFFLWWRKSARKRTLPLRNKVTIYHLLRKREAGPICNVSLILRNMDVKLASLTYLGPSKV